MLNAVQENSPLNVVQVLERVIVRIFHIVLLLLAEGVGVYKYGLSFCLFVSVSQRGGTNDKCKL